MSRPKNDPIEGYNDFSGEIDVGMVGGLIEYGLLKGKARDRWLAELERKERRRGPLGFALPTNRED